MESIIVCLPTPPHYSLDIPAKPQPRQATTVTEDRHTKVDFLPTPLHYEVEWPQASKEALGLCLDETTIARWTTTKAKRRRTSEMRLQTQPRWCFWVRRRAMDIRCSCQDLVSLGFPVMSEECLSEYALGWPCDGALPGGASNCFGRNLHSSPRPSPPKLE